MEPGGRARVSARWKGLGALVALSLLGGCGAPGAAGLPGSKAPRPFRGLSGALLADDGGEPAGYYRDAEGLSGRALLGALNAIISRHRDLGYDRARDVLFASIADPGDRDAVEDLYTGQERSGIRDRRTAYEQGMNTEHTWPQSLGAVGPAQADLHHLRPSDIKINGSRGSYPYGLVTGKPFATWPGAGGDMNRLGNDAASVLVFEPRPPIRGDIARGLYYFYTCYSAQAAEGGPNLRNFQHEAPVLARWHREDPVDAGERARNDGIFAIQGNRNPYVDRPDWLAAVGQVP